MDQTLKEHLKNEHKLTPFSTYLKEIVYGGSDGIVTTFAIVAGFTGANSGEIATLSLITVLIFGLANLFADGASMGLGNFLSIRSDQDVYKKERKKELNEITNNTKFEKEETLQILMAKGFDKEDAEKLTDIYSKNKEYWLDFMMSQELEMPDPTSEKPVLSGFATFLAFIFFGFIPLIPYVFLREFSSVFLFSIIATLIALTLLGILRWRVTKEKIFRSVIETVLIGGISAVIAFLVGSLFRA
ncbi:MAG TPA: GMP synthase [bacterium]|nr:GMP synthase [bacterium]